MTSKQRAYLRGLANTMEPILHAGKGGVSDAMIKQADDALEARELIKGKVLETAPGTAREVAEAARAGDPTAAAVFRTVGKKLGEGLAVLVDVLNPEAIVIGSIYARCEDLLAEGAREALLAEALPASSEVCRILPAALGEEIGDYAAIAAALM